MITIDDANKILNCIQNKLSVLYIGTNIKDFVQLDFLKNNKGFSVVFLKSNVMLKFTFTKEKCTLHINENYQDLFPQNIKFYKSRSNDGYVYTDLNDFKLLEELDDFYKKFCESCSNTNIGCCSRFVECSDALHCVNPNVETSFSCAYRRHLNNGNIFYGKNCNT